VLGEILAVLRKGSRENLLAVGDKTAR